MIEVEHISHGFARAPESEDVFPVLNDVSFSIRDGCIASLLGPSGCGKTTLLRLMHGLVRPLAGEIRIDGATVRKPATDRTMVFQEFNLLPWRTALRNIEFAPEMHGLGATERRARAATALARVGLAGFANYYPHQLSGGMKQRVGLARALSTNPKFLLMDEPFGALDPQIREIMQIELLKLLEAEGKTIVLVTHSIDEAIFLSDTIVIFSANPGRVLATVEIELPRPRWSNDEAIKASPEFVAYRKRLWHLLKEQLRDAAAPAPAHAPDA
ncbi:MAG TPA: ABC transporter ATP-binding protein [Stellaceae bacterium]|nr:ABC transporter ATP-binding protein [Stellaceae bacterium]